MWWCGGGSAPLPAEPGAAAADCTGTAPQRPLRGAAMGGDGAPMHNKAAAAAAGGGEGGGGEGGGCDGRRFELAEAGRPGGAAVQRKQPSGGGGEGEALPASAFPCH